MLANADKQQAKVAKAKAAKAKMARAKVVKAKVAMVELHRRAPMHAFHFPVAAAMMPVTCPQPLPSLIIHQACPLPHRKCSTNFPIGLLEQQR